MKKQVTKPGRKPRISVNKLGSYLTGSEINRIRILEDQKDPNPFQGPYYTDAQRTISKFTATNCSNTEIIIQAKELIRSKPAGSDWLRTKRKNNIKAINSFCNSFKSIPGLTKKNFIDNNHESASLVISGVTVSIRPELISIIEQDDTASVGAIKLYFSTTTALTQKTANYISTLTHLWAEKELRDSGVEAPADHSILVDVLHAKIFGAPSSNKRRRKNIRSACKGIKLQWSNI